MKKLLSRLAWVAFAILSANLTPAAWAQGANVTVLPDCIVFFSFTVVANSPNNAGYDNRQIGCTTWQVSYSNSGFSAISLLLQSASNNAGVAGTYAAFTGGTLVTGINPNTATTQTYTIITGYNPWIRIRLDSATGTGVVTGSLMGWRVPSSSGSGGGGGGPTSDVNLIQVGGASVALGQALMAASLPVTVASNQTPLPLQGTAAAGSAPSGNPVQVGGTDGTNMRTFRTDINGNTLIGALCQSQALFNLSNSGDTQIIGAGAGTIRICHISLSTVAPEDIKLTSGTGTNCGTSTADVTGLYKSVSAMALDTLGALTAPPLTALCLNQSVAQALGGIVIYSVF